MRKKLDEGQKRSNIIGAKVKPDTRKKLEYIAKREATRLSTYIDDLLTKHINDYFSHAHINWDELTPDEREGR